MSDVQASLEEYRGVREALVKAVLPVATSVDGRRFKFQTALHGLEFEAGGYVRLDGGGSPRLGLVLSLDLHTEDTPDPGCRRWASASGAARGLCWKAMVCGQSGSGKTSRSASCFSGS